MESSTLVRSSKPGRQKGEKAMPPRKMSKQESAPLFKRLATIKATPMLMRKSKLLKRKGHVVLGKWIGERHDQYEKLMRGSRR